MAHHVAQVGVESGGLWAPPGAAGKGAEPTRRRAADETHLGARTTAGDDGPRLVPVPPASGVGDPGAAVGAGVCAGRHGPVPAGLVGLVDRGAGEVSCRTR